uniref:Reverse transcriptase domain-containing protein n=1 Tax=Strongyloides venezuelensis TaxID=75913 RepID=A0A0K0FID9_STRVS
MTKNDTFFFLCKAIKLEENRVEEGRLLLVDEKFIADVKSCNTQVEELKEFKRKGGEGVIGFAKKPRWTSQQPPNTINIPPANPPIPAVPQTNTQPNNKRKLFNDRWLLNTVYVGASWEAVKPNKFDSGNSCINQEYVDELLQLGFIRLAKNEPSYVASVFLVDKKSGDKRVVFNAKKINENIVAPHFKYNDIREVKRAIIRNWFAITIDLSNAYMSISLKKEIKKIYTQFKQVPFREEFPDLLIFKYLDDWFILGENKDKLRKEGQAIVQLLEKFNFSVNIKKSSLEPSQICVFLGYQINTLSFRISATDSKVEKLKATLTSLINSTRQPLRNLAQAIGMLESFSVVNKEIRNYFTRLQISLAEALKKYNNSYDYHIKLDYDTIEEVKLILLNINYFIDNEIRSDRLKIHFRTDSSLKEFGILCLTYKIDRSGFFPPDFDNKSIGKRLMQDKEIIVESDNFTTVTILNKKTKTIELSYLAQEIHCKLRALNACIKLFYIPGITNIQADHLSRRPITTGDATAPKGYRINYN